MGMQQQQLLMVLKGGRFHYEQSPFWSDPCHNYFEKGAGGLHNAIVRGRPFFQPWRNIMNWYLEVLKKYAVFSGRARRKKYWMFVLVNGSIALVIGVLAGITARIDANSNSTSSISTVLSCISSIYSLAVVLPALAVGVRRLHDIGKSGWWLFISLIPLVGSLWLLVYAVTDSQPGDNQYGPNPKMNAQPMSFQQ
jgi:uncharacterized membrane protein YhaH (DUF805 family)